MKLDTAGALRLEPGPRGLSLRGRPGPALRRALEHLRVRDAAGALHAPDAAGALHARGEVWLGEVLLARWGPDGLAPVTRISPFELRYLASTGFPHPRAFTGAPGRLRTDLHSHFAGCPRPATLMALNPRLEPALLELAGVRGARAAAPLRELQPRARDRLFEALALPADRQSTFRDMERVYQLRGTFTKSIVDFPRLIDAVAEDYAAMGVERVELSLGQLYRRDWLEAAVAGSRRAARRGLTLRWLLAISRHNDPEWDEDLLDRLEALGGCAELCGVDWMGHETNSTRAFAGRIRRVARWADRHRPGFVIRVHAGENPAFPENVAVAAEAVRGLAVTLRIGHALYGAAEATGDLSGAFVEVNLTSNYTLNNIASTAEAPLRQLLGAGVRCVLGTDGPGLYGTSLPDELRVARLAGLSEAEIDQIHAAEADYLARAAELERGLDPAFQVPADPPPRAFTPEVARAKQAAEQARREALRARLAGLGVAVVEPAAWLRGAAGPVLCVAGAWREAWARASEATKARIQTVLADLLADLPPNTTLVTGGTRAGVEGLAHGLARSRGLRVEAALVETTPPEELDGRVHAATLIARTPHEKSEGLYTRMREIDALCLFFGGGNVVHDELRVAANLRLRFLALSGVDGASGAFAARVPHRAFSEAATALRRLEDRAYFRAAHEPFWHLGPNWTVDVAVLRPGEVLLIRRHAEAAAEPGQWALPGGFVHTLAPPGTPFRADAEAPLDAAIREVLEETGLDLAALRERFTFHGAVEGGGRDERDSPTAWSRTHLYAVHLDPAHAERPVCGGDDAEEARWFPLGALPPRMAFDHAALLRRVLGAEDLPKSIGR